MPSHLLEDQENEDIDEDSNIDDIDWDWMDVNEYIFFKKKKSW